MHARGRGRRSAVPPRPEPLRVAGRAAAVVQRAPAVQRVPTTEAECLTAIGKGDYRDAVTFLIGRAPQDVERLLGTAGVGLPQCEGLLAVVPGNQPTVRGLLLESGFRLARGNDWAKAARFVSTLDDAGIDRTLGRITDVEAKLLAKGARNTPGGGDDRLLSRIMVTLRKTPGQLFGTLVAVPSVVQQGVKRKFWQTDGDYKFHMDITFTPDEDVVDASVIAFVQTMSLLRTKTRDSLDDRKHIAKRLNSAGQGVDRADYSTSGWLGEGEKGFAKKTTTSGVEPGWVKPAETPKMHPAQLTDEPEGGFKNSTWSYETSVIAKDGKDIGLIYGVVLWGFTVDDMMQVTAIPPTYQLRPTANFATAVAAWNSQATDSPVTKGQTALTAQRSVASAVPAPSVAPVRRQPGAGLQPAGDPAARGRLALALQRSAGNAAARQLLAPAQRRGGAAVQRDVLVQRDDKDRRAKLDAIQGLPMYDLLAKLAALPADVRADEATGQSCGGPRLVVAMRAATAKGTPWSRFVDAQNAALSGLPADQIGDVVRFLGGPWDYGYYPAARISGSAYGGKFDGSLDPVGGLVTLYFRVRFDADGVRWGPAPMGTPQAEQDAQTGRAKFEADFTRVVESAWSFRGKIKALCPVGPVPAFDTKVVVTVVGAGEHTLFHLFSAGQEGRSNAGHGVGNLKVDDTDESKPRTRTVSDPTGKHPEEVTTVQTPVAHEFGHAVGLQHPHCPGPDDNCYGVTAQERRDIMGAGNLLQVIKRGKDTPHDDFAPFEAIARTWGEEHMTGAMAKCNTWSPA